MKVLMSLLTLMLIASCGKLKLSDSKHKIKVDAETYSYIVIRLDFIKEIKALCTELYPEYETPEEAKRIKLISQCTLEKMSIIDLKAITDFSNGVCDAPVTVQDIEICKVLSGGI